MLFLTRLIIFVAMVLLTVVSMWTTYVSLTESILPAPTITFKFWYGAIWHCSVFALGLSIAIGLMLFALKVAIITGHKRLNPVGVLGLIIVAFISITFNLDVLYRTADRDFFLRHSNASMREVYEAYLSEAQRVLLAQRQEALRQVARQEGELEAEIRGLREAGAGYGPLARSEEYELTLLQKEAAVDLETVEDALVRKQEADALLLSAEPRTVDQVQALQEDLRVIIKDVSAMTSLPLPPPVELESPLFAVLGRLFDFDSVGLKEIFFLTIAVFLDLGDIIGYSLVPNRRKRLEEDEPFDDEALLARLEPIDPERRLAAPAEAKLVDRRSVERAS